MLYEFLSRLGEKEGVVWLPRLTFLTTYLN